MDYHFTETQKNIIIERWGNNLYLKILHDVEIYSERWELSDLIFYEYFSINAIFFCKSKLYGDCVLKIGGNQQDTEFVAEYNTLREYNGRRYVKVYDCDIDLEKRKKIMLIERIIPGKRLSEEPSLEKRMAVFSDLYNGLHIEPEKPEIYKSYIDWVCETAEKCAKNKQTLKGLDKYIYRAKDLCLEISSVYNNKMLLHIDIFGDNIVSGNGGYKIIDPKGVIGVPAFETGQFIFNECCENGIRPKTIEIMFAYLEKSLNIPDKILRQCFYIETVRFVCHEYALENGADDGDIEMVKFAENVMNKVNL